MSNALAIVPKSDRDEDDTPTSADPILSAVQKEILEEISHVQKALLTHVEEGRARSTAIKESLQALHDAVKENTEADHRAREYTQKALASLTDWTQTHASEHTAANAHRAKIDSIHEVKDEAHEKAIHELEVEKAKLAESVARHEAQLAKTWALRGKVGAVITSLISIGEFVARLNGGDGLIGLAIQIFKH